MKTTKKFSLEFDTDLIKRLDKQAARQQRKRAQMIRVCVLKGLEFFEKEGEVI